MKIIFSSLIKFYLIIFLFSVYLLADEKKNKIPIGIEENLGAQIPSNLFFYDEDGNAVQLKKLINKPTIFLFVYYECPGICTPLMSEVASVINKLDLTPAKDYQILSISIDYSENFSLAKMKKANYFNLIKKKFPDEAWKFLTGDSSNIYSLTNSVGFMFKKEGDEFIHAGAAVFISPSGKITRYLLGTQFLPFDFKMAILEANEEKATPTVAKMLKFCFSYDSEGKKYTLNITKIAGVGIIISALVFAIIISIKPKKKI